jgi:FkbM family methyltransferase
MKFLMHSNTPFAGSGYGNQTDIVTRWMARNGHEVFVSAFYGHRGAVLNLHNITILPGSMEQWGNDIILAHYDHYRPDVFFALMDSWVLEPNVIDHMPLSLWSPIDHTPVPAVIADRLKHVRWPVAMSRHGEREMRQAGLDPFYAPHMIETQVYQPVCALRRAEARRSFGVREGRFFAATVAANKGYPSRKSLDKLVKAWAHFLADHPGGVLYLHTNPFPNQSGIDVMGMCDFYGLRFHVGSLAPLQSTDEYDVLLPDTYRMIRGDYDEAYLNTLHNAADVFVLPSMGEGFGIPIMEAQSAGCPVIVSDFTACSELGEVGYKIPIDRVDDLVFSLQGSHYCSPKVSEIIKGLEWGLEHQGDQALRDKARAFALEYDADLVMQKHLLPAFKTMAQGNADYLAFQQYRPAHDRITDHARARLAAPAPQPPKLPDGRDTAVVEECKQHGHDWAPTGVWDHDARGEKVMSVPCRRMGCEAELRIDRNNVMSIIPTGYKAEVNGIKLDIEDDPKGGVAKIIMREIETNYQLDEIDFQPDDVVLDIGAHVGIVSIYLAKKFPGIKVYAYEPSKENFARLLRNLSANGVQNVLASNRAITSDGRELTISGNPASNTGGMSAFTTPNGHSQTVSSWTLTDIFGESQFDRVKLLKIDCEGSEFEILKSADARLLNRIEHLRGEFHTNQRLRDAGYDPEALHDLCELYIPDVKIHICEISA